MNPRDEPTPEAVHDLPPIGIIGVGEIGRALVVGLCDGVDDPPALFLSPRNAAASGELAGRYGSVHVCTSNQDVVDRSSLVVVALRPQDCVAVLGGLHVPRSRCVVSVAAGLDHETLRRSLGDQIDIVRAIPLPAVAGRQVPTAVFPSNGLVKKLFDRLGGTLVAEDVSALDALSAATGSIAAHLNYLAAISDWLAGHGVDRGEAEAYVRAVYGSVNAALLDSARSLVEVAHGYTTPGGINEQLRDAWFDTVAREALHDALDGLYDRLHRSGSGS